ncbi:MAG: Ig-like domain-containing protein [Opitutaceae bacterium]
MRSAAPAMFSRWKSFRGLAAALVATGAAALSCRAEDYTVFAIGPLPAGSSVVVSYDVAINAPLPASTTQISHQVTITWSGGSTLSDDPETAAAGDATLTALDLDYDFGDAPATYGTALADNGARHFVPAGGATVYLGAAPDSDSDGQPSATANGDGADEDGVVLPTLFEADRTATLTVSANSAGYLNAWIDWNRDGDFADGGETICADRLLTSGANSIAVPVPATLSAGASFARFRITTAAAVATTPTGAAPDGEVEDYAVTLAETPAVGSVTLTDLGQAAAGATGHSFTVEYTDALGIDVSTIGTDDIVVTGPGAIGALNVTGATVSPSGNGTPRTATYTIAAPGGTWNDADNGTYTVALNDGAVASTSGLTTVGDAALATFAVSMDTTAPETTLTSTPAALSSSATASFTFIGSDAAGSGLAGYEARLDGAVYSPATSPLSITGLNDGPHTFQVRALDNAGNADLTPATHTWTIDTTAPSVPTIGSVTSAGVSGTAEAGSTVRIYDGASLLGTAIADVSGNWSLTLPLPDGSYTLTATATDPVGNTGSTSSAHTYAIDSIAPDTPVVAAASAATVTGAAEPGSTVRVFIDGSLAGTAAADGATGVWSYVLPAPLADGSTHRFCAVAIDAAGNSSPVSPEVTIILRASGQTWIVTVNTDDPATPVAGSLRYAMEQAAARDSIRFALPHGSETITLAAALPPIMRDLTIDGGTLGDVVIDGADAYRVFFVDTGTVALSNLWIQNALAQGGAGGTGDGGGGGGAGLGAGLFVNQATAVVTVTNVNFISMRAIGGAGGSFRSTAPAGGGGGGMAYRGGSTTINGGGCGGGGMLAQGGDVSSGSNGGAGGAGGGGGGGRLGAGTAGAGGIAYAGNDAGSAGATTNGGAGGFGGGGGGAPLGTGGAGGFGGGGGGTGTGTPGGVGGPGGGGGGSGGNLPSSAGGSLGSGVTGGASGSGAPSGGGGGAAAGPAIFVRLGTLTTVNSAWADATATGGAGGTGYSSLASATGTAGTADSTPTFNYAGTVNGSTAIGPIPRALIDCVPVLAPVSLSSGGATASLAKAGDTVTLSFTASRPIAVPTVILGGRSVPATHTGGNVWTASFTVDVADAEGPVAFGVAFLSSDGFAGLTATATTDGSAVTIDLTAPDTTITTQPADPSVSTSATFTFTGSGVARFEASLDGAAYTAATSPLTYTALAEGAHTIALRAIDAAGNRDATPAIHSWTVDPTPPTVPVVVATTPTSVSGTGEPGSTVRIYDGATLLGTAIVGQDGTWTLALGVLSGGAHTLTATLTDAAGNTGAGRTFHFTSTYSGDTNGDWRIDLSELLGMVELFNAAAGAQRTGAYHTDAATADGFAPGAGTLEYFHSADTDRNGRIDLPELLRAIELYNAMSGTSRTGAYHLDATTADGFAAGAN